MELKAWHKITAVIEFNHYAGRLDEDRSVERPFYTECSIKHSETDTPWYYAKMLSSKWDSTPSIVRDFCDWLFYEKTQSSRNVCGNAGKCAHFIREDGLEAFYFKKKPFYILVKDLFLAMESAMRMKVMRLAIKLKKKNAVD
jgi:hypothetical protein